MQRKRPSMPQPPRQLPPAMIAAIDIVLIGVCLVVFALFDHVIPRARQKVAAASPVQAAAVPVAAEPEPAEAEAAQDIPDAPDAEVEEDVPAVEAAPAVGDFSGKFAGKFTDGEVIRTDTTYQSANLNVTLSRREATYGKYQEVYFVEDIYVRNIECIRSIFAKDTFGRSVTESVLTMSERAGAVAAVNSDFYSFSSTGVVIRNGVLYRDTFASDRQVLILFRDGTMKTYRTEAELDVAQAMADGAWQSFCFGPVLLDENGQPYESYPRSKHDPRTAIGMIEPGHYLFVTIDGRQSGYSDGMTYKGLATLCQELGCVTAFNLDGGRTSQMTFMGAMVNHPYKDGRKTSDLIYVADPTH